jgi:hypothetical protein
MPEISLLQPIVLRGVVNKFTAPENLVMLAKIPRQPWPFPSAKWDVVRGARNIATPNVPNSEAHIIPKLSRSQESASFVYLREKKVFEPTTIHWIREVGTMASTNAEAAVLREVQDLNQRFDNFAEWMIWQSLTGVLTLDFTDVQATINYKFPQSHKIAAPSVNWTGATAQNIRDDVTAWKRLIRRDSRGVAATDIYASEPTINKVINAFTSAAGAVLLSDRMKDTWFQTGTIPGFMGLNWNATESVYDDSAGTMTQFVTDGRLLMGNFTENRPIELMEGPSADDEAPHNFTGKFAKTWKEKDPSARQFLLEWHCLPVITRPEQFVNVTNVG